MTASKITWIKWSPLLCAFFSFLNVPSLHGVTIGAIDRSNTITESSASLHTTPQDAYYAPLAEGYSDSNSYAIYNDSDTEPYNGYYYSPSYECGCQCWGECCGNYEGWERLWRRRSQLKSACISWKEPCWCTQ